jgi:hypothetical protein
MAEGKQEGPGSSPVGTIGVVVLTLYLVSLSLTLFYCLFALWPGPAAPQTGLPRNTVEGGAQLAGTSIVAVPGDDRQRQLSGASPATGHVTSETSELARPVR